VAFILLVEDHLDSARPLIRLLSIAGHKVVLAESGEAAVQALSGTALPDVMLLDVMLPGIDGMEVLRQTRGNPRTAKLPVLMLTAMGDPAFAEHALSKGANEYLVKGNPDLYAELTRRLAQYLPAA
jgi:putative two-component system response regulator